jgi:hypothetical protein
MPPACCRQARSDRREEGKVSPERETTYPSMSVHLVEIRRRPSRTDALKSLEGVSGAFLFLGRCSILHRPISFHPF